MNNGKKVVIFGVTGGIAAYKAAGMVSSLVQRGVEVHVIMTKSATQLVTPLTFMTLSQQPVTTSLWSVPEWRPEHVKLADIADLLLIAPCTVNTLGKLAGGIADNALSTYAITHEGPVILAPACNPKMWRNPALQDNVARLRSRGITLIGPADGHVACGADGPGRMTAPEEILAVVYDQLGL